ncbi:MAG: right-handed parallel beta-helix repeat-containing protein, partial [Thermodesulfobacteriota bacterium]
CIMLYAGATDCTISNCILTTDGVTAYGVDIGTSITNTYIYNCLIYDFANQGIMGYSNAFIYNNTIVNCGTGISKSSGQSGTTWTCKNVLVSGSTGNDFEMLSGTAAVTYCASSDATADDGGGTGNRINQTFTFVDAVNKDFHLASGDAGAKDFGADLSADPNIPFSVDIDGETRSGAWDIGSDEYVAAGGVIIPVSGSTAGLSAVAGLAGMAYNAAGTAIGLSGINALAGLGYIVSGSAAAVSLPYASAGIVRGVNGGLNGLSLLSGAISTYALTALAGNISTLSVLNGVAGLTFHVSGPAAGTSSFLASAGLSSLITGSASGASYFTAALTGLSANNFSGQINTISTFAGNVAMRYGLGGASPSALLLTGHLYEIYSSAGLFQAYSSLTGSPLFAGQISPASRAGSPRLDVTRYGGGTLPLMQSDSDIVTVTQDNNNPRVTR